MSTDMTDHCGDRLYTAIFRCRWLDLVFGNSAGCVCTLIFIYAKAALIEKMNPTYFIQKHVVEMLRYVKCKPSAENSVKINVRTCDNSYANTEYV